MIDIDKIEKAIEKMSERSAANAQSDHALKFSQAALNLAYVKTQLLTAAAIEKTKGTGS